MKLKLIFLFFLTSLNSIAQGEANIWYFGQNAGLDFNGGAPVALTNGQLVTDEGCATLCNNAGQLLMYTDGITVYNKNHAVMLNGTGLTGDPSSMQSATIVQKPGSTNLFYIFTTEGQLEPDGFRYSIVDLNLDGGLGAVTNDKNILVATPTLEGLGVTKHANGVDFIIVTHGINSNQFRSYFLTAAGFNSIPVLSDSGLVISGTGFAGAALIKISPSGSQLALTSVTDSLQLFNFNNSTGVVSNAQTLLVEIGELSGIAYSPDESLMYVSNAFGKIHQFNLNASNIPSSKIIIYNGNTPGQLQIGPDNKIYVAFASRSYLGVINNPNVLGVGCTFQLDGVYLGGKLSKLGLPSFNQSFFFAPAIQFDNACVGQNATLTFNTNQTVLSAVWDFGDGSATQNSIAGNHVYTSAGTFLVNVTVTTPLGTGSNNRSIVISAVPTATQPNNIFVCDNNNNGLFTFDLAVLSIGILNGQNPAEYTVKYFANATDYANNIAIINLSNYQNTSAFQQQTIIAEVSNNANSDCKATTTFNIDVFDTPLPNIAANIPILTSCDNTTVGTNSDGQVVFDLTQRAIAILNGQAASQFTITYYRDAALSNQILNLTNYQNTNQIETIYVKVVNNDNFNCTATTSFNLQVYSLPNTTTTSLKQCDDDLDGFSVFNLTEANAKISTNFANETFTYFETASAAQGNINPILNFTTYTNQIVSNDVIYVRVSNINGCFRVVPLTLIVSTTQVPVTFTRTFTQCDDTILGTNIDGISAFNFTSVDVEVRNLFPVNQQLTITYYSNLTDALAESNGIADISNYRNIGYPNTQNIFTRVDSDLNNDCLLLKSFITLNVERIPIFAPQVLKQCDDNQDGKYGFDTTNLQTTLLNGLTNVTVTYFDQNNIPLPSPLPNPFVTQSQTVKVVVTNSTLKACNFESSIQFVVDDLPEAFPIPIVLTTVCDDEANPINQDGSYSFDTSTFQNTILGSQTGMIIKYYDANNIVLSSPLPNPFVTITQNIKVDVINPINTSCKATYTIPFVVKPVPKINLLGSELVCSDLPTFTKLINAGLTDGSPTTDYTYVWKRDGNTITTATNYSLTINQAGIYTVTVTNNLGCSRTRTITVTASDKAKIGNISVIDLSDISSITITVTGGGNYVYALDEENGLYQDSNVFMNVSAGIHTIYVKDLNGCGVANKEVAILGIPAYFTPNGDEINDFWNIKGSNSTLNVKTIIYIFDRFGKLIKQISPTSQGWNGTFNNQELPASDYWYAITLDNGKTVKGHFALKR